MILFCSLVLSLPVAPEPRLVGEPWELKTGSGTLYGTLDLPQGVVPWPVVLLHAGSGPTDRDGNGPLVQTDCLKRLGRALAAEGIAVLRIDKRGIAASRKALSKESEIRLETYVTDVVEWVALLRKDARFTKVGLLGHSEGALIGLLAAKDAHPDCFVSLCGPGLPLQDLVRGPLKKGLPAKLYEQSDSIIAELVAGRLVDGKDVPATLTSLFRPSVQPYLISSFRHDPAKLVADFSKPVLIVSGTTDIQVPAADANRLAKSNAHSNLVSLDNMNHVFKMVESTNRLIQLPSYSDPTLPLHPRLAPVTTAFLKQALGGN